MPNELTQKLTLMLRTDVLVTYSSKLEPETLLLLQMCT